MWTSAADSAWTTASKQFYLRPRALDFYTPSFRTRTTSFIRLVRPAKGHEPPMPHVISELERALTTHHALLLLPVIDVESIPR